jgi:hypothetical protein
MLERSWILIVSYRRGGRTDDGPCFGDSWVTDGEIVEGCLGIDGEEGAEAEEETGRSREKEVLHVALYSTRDQRACEGGQGMSLTTPDLAANLALPGLVNEETRVPASRHRQYSMSHLPFSR